MLRRGAREVDRSLPVASSGADGAAQPLVRTLLDALDAALEEKEEEECGGGWAPFYFSPHSLARGHKGPSSAVAVQ